MEQPAAAKADQPPAAKPTEPTKPAENPRSPASDSVRSPQIPLSVDPDNAAFRPKGGRSEHMLVNLSRDRIAVKVKCSDNNLYRVNPVFCFIDGGQCNNLLITRLEGPPKTDKLALHYVKCKPSDTDFKELFKNTPATDVVKLPLTCVSKEDAPAIGPDLSERR
ncbi:unnamed protein product [Bursaphelenchus okinawaensis]|uniref:Major sperm protein n=1 Tax=Bursaphelenchus okinawaensis TaxID=465554 RepID=A0A811LL04_9BILA|nr:unnamed protein product [Bursaphelenchus okinawaensis]CAG9124369.1 unnamed protein product [Bursaphelenchus okinawaensis]